MSVLLRLVGPPTARLAGWLLYVWLRLVCMTGFYHAAGYFANAFARSSVDFVRDAARRFIWWQGYYDLCEQCDLLLLDGKRARHAACR